MLKAKGQSLLSFLEQYVTEHKREAIDHVLAHRTRYITIVLEDIYQSQNASAAVRTCECFGIQDIHVVETRNSFGTNKKVLRGSNKWVNITRYRKKAHQNIADCVSHLKSNGYMIVATDPAESGMSIHDLDVTTSKLALLFGNELQGLSEYALANSDCRVRIPMYGFTESLNISASVASCLTVLLPALRKSRVGFHLTDEERNALRLDWYRSIIRRSAELERAYLKTIQ